MSRRIIAGVLASLRSRAGASSVVAQSLRLNDGTAIVVRPVREDDKDRLAALTDSLSDESRSTVRRARRSAWRATSATRQTPARPRRPWSSATAGSAAASRGRCSVAWQRSRAPTGVRHFTGVLLSHNTAALNLLEQLGDPGVTHDDGGTVAVNLELPRARRARP
jgi:hypothetical protein